MYLHSHKQHGNLMEMLKFILDNFIITCRIHEIVLLISTCYFYYQKYEVTVARIYIIPYNFELYLIAGTIPKAMDTAGERVMLRNGLADG